MLAILNVKRDLFVNFVRNDLNYNNRGVFIKLFMKIS